MTKSENVRVLFVISLFENVFDMCFCFGAVATSRWKKLLVWVPGIIFLRRYLSIEDVQWPLYNNNLDYFKWNAIYFVCIKNPKFQIRNISIVQPSQSKKNKEYCKYFNMCLF